MPSKPNAISTKEHNGWTVGAPFMDGAHASLNVDRSLACVRCKLHCSP